MKTYFISGHRNVTPEEFEEHYAPHIREAVKAGASFVLGDYHGVDTMAQQLLSDLGATRVTVYHMFTSPRNNVGFFPMSGGFSSDEQRDTAMTDASDADILWVRPSVRGKNSGTEQNKNRRTRVDRGKV